MFRKFATEILLGDSVFFGAIRVSNKGEVAVSHRTLLEPSTQVVSLQLDECLEVVLELLAEFAHRRTVEVVVAVDVDEVLWRAEALVIAQDFLHTVIELLLLCLEGLIDDEVVGYHSSTHEDLRKGVPVLTRVGHEVPSKLSVATYQR